jgi:phosphate ABC transporter permease subunit PstA
MTTSLINFSEDDHKKQLQRRHLRGTIYENLYRLSLVLAVGALITLLLQISSQAFGPVLVVPQTPLGELTDTPEADLGAVEMAAIIVEEVGDNLVTIIRSDYGAVRDASFPTLTVAESLRGNTFPDSVNPAETTYEQLTDEQLAEFLVLNTSEADLFDMLEFEVIQPDIIGEWSWITWLLDRDRVYRESSIELTDGIARELLRGVEDSTEENALATALAPILNSDDNAATVAANFDTVSTALLETDWEVEARRVRASVEISERRSGGVQTPAEVANLAERQLQPDIEALVLEVSDLGPVEARAVADALARDIIRNGGLEEIGSSEQRDILAALMISDFADVLEADGYPLGEVKFISWLSNRFLTDTGSNSVPEEVTLRVAILGSVWVMIITMLTSFPLGVGAAIYLEEYATDNWLNNIIETNIRNLAGVPSIIYGLLGLAVFVRALEPLTSGNAFGTDFATGRTVLSAGLTLALLILPVIIINSQEAVRAVPSTIREASYGLGATKWQTIWRQILPAAFPGILTGTILAFSRAVGETAPLIVVGAAAAISVDPNLFGAFTVIPIQIFNWTEQARPEYQHLAAAAIIVLLGLLIILNSTAILLRNRFSKQLN